MPSPSQKSLAVITVIFLLSLAIPTAFGQKVDTERVETAVERSKAAAETIKEIAALPDGKGIPKDLAEKANMIGVVPDAYQLSLLVGRAVRGRGVFSVRRENGWCLPVYYSYGGTGGLSKIGSKNYDIVFVVIDADLTVGRKDKQTKGRKNKADKPQLFLYSFADGVLAPMSNVKNQFLFISGPNVVYDDTLNKLMYGVKGDDIASGTAPNPTLASSDVAAFRDSLNSLFPGK